MAFNPALLVIDFQNDFCPPNGSLAVPNAHDITAPVNDLLALPFPLKLATRDSHPPSHISFASNHPGASPFTSTAVVVNPHNASQSYNTTLWPDHCIPGTAGHELVDGLHVGELDGVLDKGKDVRVEMYSAFYDPFHVEDSGLRGKLGEQHISHVFVVGLAADYCVKATAEHAVDEGYETYIVEEATRPVQPDNWPGRRDELIAKGVKMISIDGQEVQRVKDLPSRNK